MAFFTDTAADETITPTFVSGTETRIPAGSFPSGAADPLDGGGGNDTLDGDVAAEVAGGITAIFTQAGPVGALAANAFFLGAAAGDADGNGAQAAVAFGPVTPDLATTATQFTIV